MKSTSDLKKDFKRQEAEIEKAKKSYYKSKASDDLKKISLKSEELCEIIGTMPSDEAVIVFDEILNSANFVAVFKHAINSSHKLDNLRKSKAAKAERRKAKKVQEMLSEQTDNPNETEPFGDAFSSESNGTEEAAPQSEQAELSEQNTPSDSFVYTSAEMPTDFSQKWDQATSPEQTDPPAYTGSIY